MKTTIEISDALMRQARSLAAAEGKTLRDVVEAGLRQLLSARKRERAPFRLRGASVAGRGLQKGLSYDEWGKVLDRAYGDRG